MSRTRAVLLLAVMFVLGAASGALGGVAWVRRNAVARGFGPPPPVERMELRRIARRLDLDAEQKRVLERIAGETRGRMDRVREDTLRQLDEILDQAYAELEPTLSEDQLAKLRRMREEGRRRLREAGPPGGFRRGRGGPPDGRPRGMIPQD